MDVLAPVTEVTLHEDRAHVLRRGRFRAPAGRHELRIAAVAPVVSDRTLLARLAGGAVLDARVVRQRRVLAEDRPEDLRALEAERDRERRALGALEADRRRFLEELEVTGRAADATVAELVEDAAWGNGGAALWREALDRLGHEERVLRERLEAVAAELEDRQRRLGDLERRLGARARPSDDVGAELAVLVEVAADGEHELAIEYLVPGACWRPWHTALLAPDGGEVTWRCDACVWQRTGEDWERARLRFSTERPSLGVEPPRLEDDLLALQPRSTELRVEAREEEIHTAGLGQAAAGAAELPGIDDGGRPLHLDAPRPASVPSDGRPHRVPLYTMTSPARTFRVLFAELAAEVLVKSELENRAPQPILAGPVDLVRDGGLCGRARAAFVAPGERFELGWGPDGALHAERERTDGDPDTSLLGAWIAQERVVRVHLSNLGPEPRELEVTERVPVSELEQVQIEQDLGRTTDRARADGDGLVRWRVRLDGFATRTLELRYTLKRHKDVQGALP